MPARLQHDIIGESLADGLGSEMQRCSSYSLNGFRLGLTVRDFLSVCCKHCKNSTLSILQKLQMAAN